MRQRVLRTCLFLALGASVVWAQTAPVVAPRGVTNAFTQQPAPTTASDGGLIWITGLNLSTPEGASIKGAPAPSELGSVKVLVNNQPIPLLSVSPGKIVAQLPWDIFARTNGATPQLTVEVGGVRSRNAARFFVAREQPGVRSKNDSGYGEVAGTLSGAQLKISATGLGALNNDVDDGAAGAADLSTKPKGAVTAMVGGIPANVGVALSPERVGEFDLTIDVPADAQPGDVLQIYLNNRAANRVTLGAMTAPEMRYLPMPEGADVRALSGSDLRGTYVLASGPRGADGCYASYLFDFARNAASALDKCLTVANRNAASPFVPVNDGAAVAAFVGPPPADAQNVVSAKVKVFNPALPAALEVALPSAANALVGAGGETVVANIPGTPVTLIGIDVNTGETRAVNAAAIGGGGGGTGGGGAVVGTPTVDLGDGLKHVLTSRIQLGNGRSVVAVGDDAEKPKKAKLAVLNQQNAVVLSEDFPDGFVPLISTTAPLPAGQTGGAAAQALANRIRTAQYYDTATRVLYIVARKPDASADAFAAFTIGTDVRTKAVAFPEKTFVANCSNSISLYTLELSRTLALLATNTAEGEYKQVCDALGFVSVDLTNQRVRGVALDGAGTVNVSTVFDMNDYLVGTNVGGARQPADTVHVYDGVNGTAKRIQLPAGVTSFANLRSVGAAGLLMATLQKTTPGDQGFFVFDLDDELPRVLTVPDGFAVVQLVDVMTATRKIVARGTKTGNTGTQYMVYDLLSADLTLIPNPPGVAWVGAVPAQAPAAGGGAGGGGGGGAGGAGGTAAVPTVYQDSNPKANTISAVCFDADRKPVGVLLARIP